MPRPKATYAQPYLDRASRKPDSWTLFFITHRDEADRIARWCRREGALARLMELDDRTLLAVKVSG